MEKGAARSTVGNNAKAEEFYVHWKHQRRRGWFRTGSGFNPARVFGGNHGQDRLLRARTRGLGGVAENVAARALVFGFGRTLDVLDTGVGILDSKHGIILNTRASIGGHRLPPEVQQP